ncbi:MAG: helix-turn-helix domain-containing protein [Clostridia bacterium]|nr:helix-turn-helix domain-containing protein [Clostridia bacterium]
MKENRRKDPFLTLEKLCTIIGCEPNDIVKFTEE